MFLSYRHQGMEELMKAAYCYLFAMMACATAAHASFVNGAIIGAWQNPVLAGNVIEPNAPPLFLDNTKTAFYEINNSSSPNTGSSLIWGFSSTGAGQPFSELNFFGS